MFQVDGMVTALISRPTITGGNAGSGGGVTNLGSLGLNNCTVSGNSASNGGGGVFNKHGSLAMANCTIGGNSARTAAACTTCARPR